MNIPEELLNRPISVEGEELTYLRAQVMEWLSKLSGRRFEVEPEIEQVIEEMRKALK